VSIRVGQASNPCDITLLGYEEEVSSTNTISSNDSSTEHPDDVAKVQCTDTLTESNQTSVDEAARAQEHLPESDFRRKVKATVINITRGLLIHGHKQTHATFDILSDIEDNVYVALHYKKQYTNKVFNWYSIDFTFEKFSFHQTVKIFEKYLHEWYVNN